VEENIIMMMKTGLAAALLCLVATGTVSKANAENTGSPDPTASPSPKKKKKTIQRKPISRNGDVTLKAAKEDHHTLPQAPVSTMSTTSMPNVATGKTTDAPKPAPKTKWTDNLRAGVLFEYYGSSITDPLNGFQTDKEAGYAQGPNASELDTRVYAGYALTPNITATYNVYFWSYGDSFGGSGDGQTFQYRPGDSFLRFNFGKFVQVGKFKWSGDFRIYLPEIGNAGNSYSRWPLYLRTGQNLSYSLTPRLNLAMYNSIRYYYRAASAYNADHDPTSTKIDGRATFGPAIEYQIWDALGVSLSYNLDYAHTHTRNEITPTENVYFPQYTYAYWEIGASIDATKFLNINPYVDMYDHAFYPDAFQFGANVNFTFL
jgi:hypothetical protein